MIKKPYVPYHIVVENRVSKFKGLIKSASSMYAHRIKNSRSLNYMDYDDFVSTGFLTLTVCLNRWKNKNKSEEEFGKYFKTSLYHKYQSMLDKAFAKKRTAYMVDIDDFDKLTGRLDFETGVKELADHIMAHLNKKLERKIFKLWVDPPKKLRLMAIMENRRKMKIAAITESTVCGMSKVKISNDLVIRYLRDEGNRISVHAYNDHFRNLRSKVRQIVKENGFN